ncbi:MAG: CDP-glycerol glycerophosphotransferase family protein [Clostridia bacterium]|nr:CDP-glycerol glycerophosphotransferase family protein [Clostridia bacterium]
MSQQDNAGALRKKLRELKRLYRRMSVWYYRLRDGVDPKKAVFMSFQGRSYNDNPRFISERLHERCPEAKIVWLFKEAAMPHAREIAPDYVKIVHCVSPEAYHELATARVWVDNFTKSNLLRHKKGQQFYIQTWHGDRPIKKICYDEPMWAKGPYRIEERADRVLTGSKFGENMYRTAFRYKGEYITEGAPRNDMLVRSDPGEIRRVRERLGVPGGVKLLLYAPTYRENAAVVPKRAQMDLMRTLDCLEKKTGDRWLCLFRAHYKSQGIDLEAVKDRLVDVSQYDEMAELLLAADMVLTDYSTAATDFILRDKPALFFVADWAEYISTREVYFDVHDAPFLLSEDQPALEKLIEGLTEEKIKQNCADIRDYFGVTETGRATDAVCDYILECMKG